MYRQIHANKQTRRTSYWCVFESRLSCISVAVRSVSPSMDIPLTVLTPFVQALGQVSMFRERNVLVDLNILTMGAGYLFEWSLS